jgi:hypothetical protein
MDIIFPIKTTPPSLPARRRCLTFGAVDAILFSEKSALKTE